jgi:hypothetical protein
MSAGAIGPGSVVECVAREPHLPSPYGGLERLVVGATYQVKDALTVQEVFVLVLWEVKSDAPDGAYQASHFRLRPDRPWIAALLTITTDSKVDQPETVGG